jgi:hypothetical protein
MNSTPTPGGAAESTPPINANTFGFGATQTSPHHQEESWDAIESYFECITTCSLEDGECVTRCVDTLRDHS